MALRRMTSLVALFLLASTLLVYGQGINTRATKDDWEEINYEFNSSILSDGYPTLLRIADLLKQNPDYKLKVEGHTDFIGSAAYNEKLALARADTVKTFLVKYGASAGQILTSGQGKRSPEVPNTSKEGRFINRRVVLTLSDGAGKVIAAGSGPEILAKLDERLKKLEDCCSQILKKLDKLDEILAAIRDLKSENDRLKADVAQLKGMAGAPGAPGAPGGAGGPGALGPQLTPDDVNKAVGKALDDRHKAKESAGTGGKKFSVLAANVGPTTAGELNFTGKTRYFAPFGHSAIQAEAEFMYYRGENRIEGRQEGQFDIGLLHRWNAIQVGTFASFKHVNIRQFQNGGTLGQTAFTLDYVFNRGRLGFFGTKGFLDEAVINRVNLGPSSFLESYLKIVDQAGGHVQVGLYKNAFLEGNLGYLHRTGSGGRPGGMVRFVHPVSNQLAFTLEAGLNETLLTAKDSGRVAFGLQFGNWLRPKEFNLVKHPVPVEIPRVRYEVLTRRVGNSAPVADAGPDLIGVPAGSITLDGSASYDPDGDTLTFAWVQTSGPTIGLSGQNTARATFTAEADTTYTFRLTVKDPGGLQSTARVRVTTRPNPTIRILRFQALPNVIKPGASSTITWQVENADTVDITGLGSVDPRNGTSQVTPAQTTIYRLTAKNKAGQEVNEQITITVERIEVYFTEFSASPATIIKGESSTLTWEAPNAQTVKIDGVGTFGPKGTVAVTPAATTTYNATACSGSTQDVCATRSTRVQVVDGAAPRIIRFSSTPAEILPTEQAALVWLVENADEVSITNLGKVEPQGTSTVSPAENTTYILTAKNKWGEVSASTVVGVIAPVKILDFVADPPTTHEGDPVTLRWSTANATEVIITGVGPVPATGSVVIRPAADVSYTLLAYGKRSQASAFVLVKVLPKITSNRPPVANAGADQTLYRNTASLDGTRSFDPDNDPITYAWRLVSFQIDPASPANAASIAPSLTGASSATPTLQMPMWGTYLLELTVTDPSGAKSSAYTRVTFVDP